MLGVRLEMRSPLILFPHPSESSGVAKAATAAPLWVEMETLQLSSY